MAAEKGVERASLEKELFDAEQASLQAALVQVRLCFAAASCPAA